MKFKTVSGRSRVSLTQDPGLGSGTSPDGTGNHIDVLVACSLNKSNSKKLIDLHVV